MNNNVKGYIICESALEPVKPTIISKNGVDRVTINTTLQSADVKNRNKRIYPKVTIQNGLNSPYVQERLRTNSFYGEAGHPLNPDIKRQLYIDQGNISHLINKVWWEGNLLKGTVTAANTARGADFDGLIRQGSEVAFSLRAVGPVVEKRGDTTYVRDPLTIFTYDWVIHPSHPEAYMDNIINRGGSLTESGIFIPLQESEALQYATDVSRNIKIVSNMFDGDAKAIALTENNRNVILQSSTGEKAVVFLEDYLQHEINSYLRKLK